MVFSSIPVYLDPPNWQQQPNRQKGDGRENPQLLPPVPPLPPGGGGGTGSIRPCSMAERARLAKIPQPEAGLKCPRCDSSNTKFCYFNNYSLSQPRHFCKTCRRYWTRGGALRNVPVGGGCRRNKRSKRSRSKSPAAVERQSAGSCSNSAVSNGCTSDVIGHFPPPTPQLPFLPSLHQLSNFGAGDVALNFGGNHPSLASRGGGSGMEFQIGSNSCVAGPTLSSRFGEQLRLQQVQQFPFFTGIEPSAGMYQFENEGVEPSNYVEEDIARPASRPLESGVTQLATVKPEENQGFNLSRSFLGIPGNDQYWGGNSWTDLSGFNSYSTGHLF